jgi:MFS family permease
MVAALGVLFGLNETLESVQDSEETRLRRIIKRIKQSFTKEPIDQYTYTAIQGNDIATPLTATSESAPAIPKPPKRKRKLPFRRIWTFNVVCTMLSHFVIAGHLGTFSILWAIFLSTPVGDTKSRHPPFIFNGGLGMLPRDVGFAMTLLGAIGVVLQLVVYPLLQDRFGTIRIWRTALLVFPIVYFIAPFPSLVASSGPQKENTITPLVWLATGVVIVLFIVGRTGVTPATTLLINDCTPHPSVRGTIHTAGTVIGNLGRSLFPIGALVTFGQGLWIGVVGLGFWCLMALAMLASVASLWVTEGANGLEVSLDDDDDSDED